MIPDPYTFNHKGHHEKTFNIRALFVVTIVPVHESTGVPLPLYGTVGSRDAAVERTGTYSQRA
ncbi:MAG: hypothetical protein U9Q19_07965, partial [Pseudomonadota bacterium]|nr:hypothetical protein [Pseudomonadota bacterium]